LSTEFPDTGTDVAGSIVNWILVFQTQRVGFVLQHLQCQQKNLKHFSEECDVVRIIKISDDLCTKRCPQKPSTRCALKDPISWEKK